MFKSDAAAKASNKAEITGRRILDGALNLFRTKGFEEATMRDIAAVAGVAIGAAYYYYPSKDAIVLAFYQRSCIEMQPRIEEAVAKSAGNLEDMLTALIHVKLEYFAPYRGVLRALLKNGADPGHPLSPFSQNNKSIRDVDIAWFEKILNDCRIRVPQDLAPHLPDVLWMFQMGVIYFWITDDSHGQHRTDRLLALGARVVTSLLKIAGLPLTRPLRKIAIELIEIVRRS
ncbi:MAG TPA: TetR family transcriptional regulator [Candidatus Acidoferrales bacterium]|nr:TetR family transcriptional regulator [Candidatus Acidoferrales bacterium]